MDVVSSAGHPSCSARLLAPFLGLLKERSDVPEVAVRWLSELDPDERVRASAVDALLQVALQLTGDPLLGLKAAARMELGDVGIIDFILSSACTVREALEGACRYVRLLDDGSHWKVDIGTSDVRVQWESSMPLTGVAEDFAVVSFLRTQSPNWPEGMAEHLDVWIQHALPDDATPYREALGPVRLHFSAAITGFGFPAHYLDQPLRSSDPRLHALLCRYGESSLAALPNADSISENVRGFVLEKLASGNFSLEDAARRLRISSRTLGRRLADEGTTFKQVVDDARKMVALRHVTGHEVGLSEIAVLAGFTETPSFYRAFRRWTGVTPSQYRSTHRGELRSAR